MAGIVMNSEVRETRITGRFRAYVTGKGVGPAARRETTEEEAWNKANGSVLDELGSVRFEASLPVI